MLKEKYEFFKKLFEPALLDKSASIKIVVHGLVQSFLIFAIPLIFIPKITELLQKGLNKEALVYATLAVFLFVVFYTIRHIYMYSWHWAMSIPFATAIYKKYLPQIVLMEPSIFEKNGTGYHLSKFNSGTQAICRVTRSFLAEFPSAVFITILSLSLSYTLGFVIGALFTILIIFAIFSIIHFFKEETKILLPSVEIENQVGADISRVIMSKQEVLYSNKTSYEIDNIVKKQNQIFNIEKNAFKYSIRRMSPIWMAPFFTLLVFFVLQSAGLINLTLANITLVILLIGTFNNSIETIFSLVGNLSDSYKNILAFFEIISEPQMKGYETGAKFIHKDGSIELKNVSFSYNESATILEDFSLKVAGGEKLAFVGVSGSGKTTIAKLITGYMRPTRGEVIIDGQILADTDLKSYYPYIGYLTQEPMVFDGTIRENLLYGVSGGTATDELLRVALQKAQCQFVLEMASGLETHIGEKGVRLSGGERQRLAIAKLFLKNPEIIVLDEPTSALDSFSEDSVTRAMEELFKGRTVIIIAHRLQTVKRADRIVVLNKGKIIEEGTHKELSQSGGAYARMLEMQSGF